MPSSRKWARAAWFATSLLGLAAGCIVVQPLKDYPEASSTAGGSSSGGHAGAASGAEAGEAPSAGKAGTQNAAGASSGLCTTNADCRAGHFDEPYLCRQSDHKCQKLRTEVCPLAFADEIANPNAIVFGAFATLSATNPDKNAIVYAHRLALEELSGDNLGGLPDGPQGASRPLAMVVCYNQDDKVEAALDHLIDDLEIKAVVATLKPGDLRRAYENHTGSDVFYLSPVPVTETVVKLDDAGKVWNLMGQPADLAPAYGSVLKYAERYVRATHGTPSGGSIRVALVTTLDAFDSETATKVTPFLSFNGKTLAQNQIAGDYKAFTAMTTTEEDVASVTADLIAFRPDIIVSAASEVLTKLRGIIEQTEAAWDLDADAPPLPMYVLSPYNAGDLTHLAQVIGDLYEFTGEDEPQQRFIGVSIAGPEDISAKFEYEGRLGGLFGAIYNDTSNYYDSTYLLAYAMYAAGTEQPLTGSSIARGMRRLLEGQAFPIHPDEILDVFDALRDGVSSIEVQSTLGPPSFDATTGVRQVDGSVFCFARSGETITPRMDTLRYDRDLKDLRQTDEFCFPDFFP